MIVFEWNTDTANNVGRVLYWLGSTYITGKDEEHSNEIYEQLMAHESHLDEVN